MSRRSLHVAALLAAFAAVPAFAQDVLIRNATVHTAGERGTLQNADVLVQGGRIAAIGSGLSSASAQVVDAQGKPLTPALFGGITATGPEKTIDVDDQPAQVLHCLLQLFVIIAHPWPLHNMYDAGNCYTVFSLSARWSLRFHFFAVSRARSRQMKKRSRWASK